MNEMAVARHADGDTSIEQVVAAFLESVAHMCSDGGPTIVELSLSQMLAMSGLDLSSEEGSCRRHLYRWREEMQQELGLYFTAGHGGGLRFTRHHLVGMLWREDEFEKAVGVSGQLVRMWDFALEEFRDAGVAEVTQVLSVAVDRDYALQSARDRIRGALVQRPPLRVIQESEQRARDRALAKLRARTGHNAERHNAKVLRKKERHPHFYCPAPGCTWRTEKHGEFVPCIYHPPAADTSADTLSGKQNAR